MDSIGTNVSPNSLEYASIVSNWENANKQSLINRPTIFDILAQENMNSLFQSAFNHFFKWLTSQFRQLRRFKKFGDEIYLAIHSSIEFLYLKAYNSLFSEYFYSMKRVPTIISNKTRLFSALFSILIPYLKHKMDKYYEEVEKSIEEQDNLPERELNRADSIKSIINSIMLKFYPYLHLLWIATFWYYKLKYLIRKSDVHSPIFSILGQRLAYDTSKGESFSMFTFRDNFLKTSLYMCNQIFTTSLYFLQFLKWYQEYTESRSPEESQDILVVLVKRLLNRNKRSDNNGGVQYDNDDEIIILPPPEVPDKLQNNKHYKFINEKPSLCPLCTKERRNQSVLSVSGFVFCYPCIFRFVKENKRCPITSYPCTTKSIIKIYADSE